MQYVPPSNQELQDWNVDTRGVSASVILYILCVGMWMYIPEDDFQCTILCSVLENCLHSENHNSSLVIHAHRWMSVIQEQKNLPRTCSDSLCPPREGEPDIFHYHTLVTSILIIILCISDKLSTRTDSPS